MAGETCEYHRVDGKACGESLLTCSPCDKTFCVECFLVHRKEVHPEPIVEPQVDPTQVPSEPPKSSAFDVLMVVDKPLSIAKTPEWYVPAPTEPEEPISEEKVGEMFSAEMGRVVAALDLLAKRGLNQAAVVALIHDAEPKITKSAITTVLKTLRQLPEIYGRKKPGRQKV